MPAVRVSLSSGEFFFVAADLDQMEKRLNTRRLVRIGGRSVNSTQVAQLTVERDVPSIHTPEILEDD